MKRIGNRGFMLIETMIVSIFAMTVFVFIYRNAVPMLGQYEKVSRYDDVDSVYAADAMKKMITSYLSFEAIDALLENNTYVEIQDCNNTNFYSDATYCSKLKRKLRIEFGDYVILTRYNPSEIVAGAGNKSFRDVVEADVKFDSGNLSNFRDYLHSVPDSEEFYNANSSSNRATGTYRLFITRSVPLIDGSTRTAYANIGIYRSNYTATSVGTTAELKVYNSTLVLEPGENFDFLSNLGIRYTHLGGTTACNPANNSLVRSQNQTISCTLSENTVTGVTNPHQVTFIVKHGYAPRMDYYEGACNFYECGCEPDATGTVPAGCVPQQCSETCSGTIPVCYKGGTYDYNEATGEGTRKCIYSVEEAAAIYETLG